MKRLNIKNVNAIFKESIMADVIIIKEHIFDNGDKLILYVSEDDFAVIGKVAYFAISFLQRIEGDIEQYYINGTEYFSLVDCIHALFVFSQRMNSSKPHIPYIFSFHGHKTVQESNDYFLNLSKNDFERMGIRNVGISQYEYYMQKGNGL